MIWNPSTHQQLACPGEHYKPGGSSWRCPIPVNGVVHNWGSLGSCGWGAAGCGRKGAPKEAQEGLGCGRAVLQPAELLQSQLGISNHSQSSQGIATLAAQSKPCVTATHHTCHLHTEQEGHTLRTITRGFSVGSAQEGETAEWCMRMYLCCENPWGPFPKVTQTAAFSFQFPFLRLTPFFLFSFFISLPAFFIYTSGTCGGLILNIYSLRLVNGIYFNLLYIIVCFWLYMTINLLEFIALWLVCFHDVLALNLWILWRVYWGWISHFSFHLLFLFKFQFV